jgi:hypothetical protein
VATQGGVFGHLATKESSPSSPISIPAQTMTWDKFQRTVLPTAEKIEFYVPNKTENYTAFVTAADPCAPPILQWDRPERRNPVSWYVYSSGSHPNIWGLRRNTYVEVNAVTLLPSSWYGSGITHDGESAIFLLKGAKDVHGDCLALFPESLRSELHGVRSTIEAYGRSAKLEPVEGEVAAGIRLVKGSTWNLRFRVTSNHQVREYLLDRWD